MTEPSELFTKKDSLPKSVTALMLKAGIDPMAFWILFEYYQIPSGWEDGDTPGHEEWKFYLPEYDKDPIYLTEEGHEREIDKIPAFSAEQLWDFLPLQIINPETGKLNKLQIYPESGSKIITIAYQCTTPVSGFIPDPEVPAAMLRKLDEMGLLTKGTDND